MIEFPAGSGSIHRVQKLGDVHMLEVHTGALESSLVAISKVPANSGHSLHKGTPREAFIRKFLESHLPENIAIGTGEIIDANSSPGDSRNQFDIVLYKKNYPKLDFGGGVSGFLVESVVATVEVKSTLDEKELERSISAAKNAKALEPNTTRSFSAGWIPPKVINYVIAYDGPAKMETVFHWIPRIYSRLGIVPSALPKDAKRFATPSESIDAVFVLRKGFLCFDNSPLVLAEDVRPGGKNINWVFADTTSGSLLLFFLCLQMATANIAGEWLNPVPYLKSFSIPSIRFGGLEQIGVPPSVSRRGSP